MLNALISALTTRLASWWYGGEEPMRHGAEHSVVAPYQAFRTADGWAVAGRVGRRATPGRGSARRSTGPTSSSIRSSRTTQLAWPIARS